jgi:hypothetical protein
MYWKLLILKWYFRGFHEGLPGLPASQDTYYAHILSLNATGENDVYTVSGLDASSLPTQISWEYVGASLPTQISWKYVGGEDTTNATNTSIYGTDNTIHTPLIIAVYSFLTFRYNGILSN